jgi:aminopeptidase YwaD
MYTKKTFENIKFFSILILFLFLLSSCGQNKEVTVEELGDHIKYLASDQLKGRETGSVGDSLAAEYIRSQLASCDFVPLSGDGFQRFIFTAAKGVDTLGEIIRETGKTRNVVMMLPGEDDSLKNEFVIIGAHFDHLGMGGTGSSSMRPDSAGVHHGADDNASGVGMMMEIAEKFALSKGSHPRTIICVAFTGEEKGLLGSKYFTDNPGIDLSKVNAMINLDMLGRLQESNILQVNGVGTSADLKDLVNSLNDSSSIKLAFSEAGFGPSDHASFYIKNIPVLFFTTGAHSDYHTPSDTYDRINYMGMEKVSSLIFDVAHLLVSSPEKLIFKEAGPKEAQGGPMRRNGVTLGIMPDFNGNEKTGLRADIVTPGKPAASGGMKNGDIITAINGETISNVYDYMSKLGKLKTGQKITVEILRDGNKMTLLIQL